MLIDQLFFIPRAMEKESQIGTIRYLLYFLGNSIAVQLTYTLLAFLLHFRFSTELFTYPINGLLPIFFADIAADCFKQPESIRRYIETLL